MKHIHKVKMARRMRTPDEIRTGVPIFDSKAWNAQKKIKAGKVAAIKLAADFRKESKSKEAK